MTHTMDGAISLYRRKHSERSTGLLGQVEGESRRKRAQVIKFIRIRPLTVTSKRWQKMERVRL